MQKMYKVAVARIFADLIKADRIIDIGEMECWRSICSKLLLSDKTFRGF